MRHGLPLLFIFFVRLISALAQQPSEPGLTEWQGKFRSVLAAKVQAMEKANTAVSVEPDGWLFLRAELRFLTLERFWGADAAKLSRAPTPDIADPVPAILDFRDQLKQRGIDLVLMPVPAKAAIYPERIAGGPGDSDNDAAPFLHQFYTELGAAGIDVLDLTELFRANRAHEKGAMFCRSDTHWSGIGCALAAHMLAERLKPKLPANWPTKSFVSDWRKVVINGDLSALLPPGVPKAAPEEIAVRIVAEKGSGAGVQPDQNSPVLLLGDSHTLVFHDFLCDKAGLVDQLALELGFAPDLIGTRGSGATPVRVNLYRDSSRNPEYLAKKKVVVWCFTAREFSEADQGWRKLPIAK